MSVASFVNSLTQVKMYLNLSVCAYNPCDMNFVYKPDIAVMANGIFYAIGIHY